NEAEPDFDLKVRVGINTGEAVAAVGARPEQGEGLVTGDVVNTAARTRSTDRALGRPCGRGDPVRRGRLALAGVRERARARVRAPRPGPLPARPRPARSPGAAARSSEALHVDGLHAGARRDRGAARAGDRRENRVELATRASAEIHRVRRSEAPRRRSRAG